MGGILSIFERLFRSGNYKICLVGLDNAGKTTTLYKLHLGEVVVTQPTIGSNVEEITYKNVKFEAWDLGGQESLRPSWSTYFTNTQAVIMVVDSTDRDRISMVRDELFRILSTEELKGAVVLVFANKQDVRGAMKAAEITELCKLHNIKDHEWHIQSCCALTGEGLMEGLDWIAKHVKRT